MERTPRCQNAINEAKQATARLGSPHVTNAHLVLGLATGQAAVINRQSFSGPVDFESIPAVIQEFKAKNAP